MRTLLLLLFLLLTPRLAAAAPSTLTVANSTSLPRLDRNRAPVTKRALTLQPEAINRADCLDDQRIRFPVQMAGFEANAVMQAWVSASGTDCSQPTSRAGAAQTCWRAMESDIPLASAINVDIPVRDLIAGLPPFSPATPDKTGAVCGKVDLTTVSVQFLYFDPGNASVPSSTFSLQLVADTVPPARPSTPMTAPVLGNPSVVFVRSNEKADGVLRVFCSKILASSEGALPVCPSTIFGQTFDEFVPDAAFESQFDCPSAAQATNGDVVAQRSERVPFEQGGSFSFNITKTDAFGNMSQLSDTSCITLNAGAVANANANANANGDDNDASTFTCSSSSAASRSGRFSFTALVFALIMVGIHYGRRHRSTHQGSRGADQR